MQTCLLNAFVGQESVPYVCLIVYVVVSMDNLAGIKVMSRRVQSMRAERTHPWPWRVKNSVFSGIVLE